MTLIDNSYTNLIDLLTTGVNLIDHKIAGIQYAKWLGANWVFAALADIGYPPGDNDLVPVRDQIYHLWLHPDGFNI